MVREEECSSLWEEKLESISQPGNPGNVTARHTCVPVHTPVLIGTMNFVAQSHVVQDQSQVSFTVVSCQL